MTIKFNEQPTAGRLLRLHRDAVEQGELGPRLRVWFPDWDGNGAQSYFSPLLDGRHTPTVRPTTATTTTRPSTSDIDDALTAPTISAAATDWAQLDNYVMTKNPAWIPLLYQALPQFVGLERRGTRPTTPFMGDVDMTNLWVRSRLTRHETVAPVTDRHGAAILPTFC